MDQRPGSRRGLRRARGVDAPDPALYDAVSLKTEVPVSTFREAFRVAGARRTWDGFDLGMLKDCHEAFEALALPDWVHDLPQAEDHLTARRSAMFTSHDLTWCTPPEVVDRVRLVSGDGKIGLDPCGNARSIVRAAVEWHGPPHDKDGLAERWAGRGLVFVNPPYAREIRQWVAKCALEAMDGAEVIALVPSRTDTKWWHEAVVPHASTVCFWRGRIKFLGADCGAPFPSAVILYSQSEETRRRFHEAFGGAGCVVDKKEGWR